MKGQAYDTDSLISNEQLKLNPSGDIKRRDEKYRIGIQSDKHWYLDQMGMKREDSTRYQ